MSKDYPREYLGHKLKQFRLDHGLTQKALGEAIGVHRVQIAKYEAGTDQMSLYRLYEIADALGVSPKEFFE